MGGAVEGRDRAVWILFPGKRVEIGIYVGTVLGYSIFFGMAGAEAPGRWPWPCNREAPVTPERTDHFGPQNDPQTGSVG